MLFNSFEFLLFFPAVVLCYYLIPHKFRYIWIFVSSYFFYMCWNPIYGLLLAGVTVLTYFSARLIDRCAFSSGEYACDRHAKRILALTVTICLIVLCLFKYLQYFANTICGLLGLAGVNVTAPTFSIVVPVGISFYLFQSLGYVIDVYRGKIRAERNLIMYAAYISFFPQLVAGPIERADRLLPQFYSEHTFNYDRVKKNLLLMLWGFFLKIVIADRLAMFVDKVYDNYDVYGGWLLIVATVFFAFQIYCDFAGYSLIAKGAAGVMGFELMDNFDAPYCSSGVRKFWARWHISLTSWFRDYVYIPLGGNRRGKVRKYINTLIVFLLSGLWHGPSWSFVVWGGLNGAYIVAEELWGNLRQKVSQAVHFSLPAVVKNIIGTIVTFVLVDFAWIFFRAPGLRESVDIIRSMLSFDNFEALTDGTISNCLMEIKNFYVAILGIVILLTVDTCHRFGVRFRELILKQKLAIRWFIYWLSVMIVLMFGIWGPGFDKTAFIYFQF